MKKYAVNGFIVGVIFIMGSFFTATSASCATTNGLSFENLTQEVGRGFGDTWNRYAWSMEEFNKEIYVGTWNSQIDFEGIINAAISGEIGDIISGGNPLEGIGFSKSKGAEIWKYNNSTWDRVYEADEADSGFRKMVEYNGKLYAGTLNSTEGASLVCFNPNSTKCPVNGNSAPEWSEVSCDMTKNANNISIRTMLVHNEELYVGTENNKTGGELWKYNGTTWTQIQTFKDDASVAELAVYDNKMYVGTWNFTDKFGLYESSNCNTFTDVTPKFDGSDELSNLGVMQLKVFKDKLFLGTVNYENGFTLLSYEKPNDQNPEGKWNVITTDGLGDPSNAYSWSMQEWNGKLYLGTFNDGLYSGIYDPLPIPLDGRAQLWCSENGENWSQVMGDGFGSAFNYGIRTMTVTHDGRLVMGTASNMMIPDPLVLDSFLTGILGNIAGVDISALRAHLASISNSNWIGAEIWATENGQQAPVPEPATILLLGIGLAGLAKFRTRGNKG